MLRFAQHDKKGGCAPFSMTKAVSFRTPARNPLWMLCFAQHDKKGECAVLSMTGRCHSERSEESIVDASLRSA